ncbi:MAG: hypothetical protein AB9866_10335 [Syntrophobacteraceae bacterium]
MADIKSTLDLVMERTRHLSMSEEDRREQAAAELKANINRLTQKYLDGTIDSGKFHDEFTRLEGASSPSARAIAVAEIGRRIELTLDNRSILELLKHGVGIDVSVVESILDRYRITVAAEERDVTEQLRKSLLKEGISGSAVVPNPEANNAWAMRREEIAEQARLGLLEAIGQTAV